MAKITRSTLYPFGSTAGSNQMVTFGSLAAGSANLLSGTTATPSQIQGVVYTFTISSHSASAGATYTDSGGNTFTVVTAISSATTLLCTGTGAPANSGTLTYVSGTPTGNITYSAYTAAASTQYLEGWYGGVAGATNSPTIQDVNSLMSLQIQELGYLLQEGIPEFDVNTTYYYGSICQLTVSTTSSVLYQYINATGSSGNTPPNGTYWNIISRDTNSNYSATNLIDGFTTAATAAATTSLLVSSNSQQYFTGTTASQVVAMPVVSTLVAGMQYTLTNNSTQTITVQSSGGNVIQVMAANTQLILTCILITGTGTASWDWIYSSGNSGNTALIAPTVQTFLGGAGLTYYTFTITSHSASLGATYTNNGSTFTVVYAVSSGTTLVCSTPGGAPTSGSTTLTYVSGTPTGNIAVTSNVATGQYQRPTGPTPLYLRVRMVGGGGGGGGSGSGTTSVATVGTATTFAGASAGAGGLGVTSAAGTGGGAGGTFSLNSLSGFGIIGGYGGGSQSQGSTTIFASGTPGGVSSFGGGGAMGAANANAGTAAANSGSGGGGAGGAESASTGLPGSGGGAGAYVEIIIPNPAATYTFQTGLPGAGGIGTSFTGGAGGSGMIEILELYQ